MSQKNSGWWENALDELELLLLACVCENALANSANGFWNCCCCCCCWGCEVLFDFKLVRIWGNWGTKFNTWGFVDNGSNRFSTCCFCSGCAFWNKLSNIGKNWGSNCGIIWAVCGFDNKDCKKGGTPGVCCCCCCWGCGLKRLAKLKGGWLAFAFEDGGCPKEESKFNKGLKGTSDVGFGCVFEFALGWGTDFSVCGFEASVEKSTN